MSLTALQYRGPSCDTLYIFKNIHFPWKLWLGDTFRRK